MKSMYLAAALAALMGSAASAETIGVSMQSFDNNFQTLLREGISARASETGGVNVQIEDAQTDISKQLNQVFPSSSSRPRTWPTTRLATDPPGRRISPACAGHLS